THAVTSHDHLRGTANLMRREPRRGTDRTALEGAIEARTYVDEAIARPTDLAMVAHADFV
ncbi:MAG: hypothetical protein ACRD8A_10620, partial [Candidatus Acidiferrales bacterium]